jgi:type IV secretion system protein VirB6
MEPCPAPGPEDPLVRGLLSAVDCNVNVLVESSYAALFQPNAPFAAVLTGLLVVFVAILGYRLMLGQAALRLGDVAMTAAKLGLVLAFATQWSLYERLVYEFLFDGPQAIADGVLNAIRPAGSVFRGDVFDSLQQTIDFLGGQADSYASRSPLQASPLLGGPGFGAFALTTSASILLFSSVGVLMAAKIVLGLLLAIGPIFIALALFETTRGLFEGWLRAALALAFAPLATTVLLGFSLSVLEPWLVQLSELRAANDLSLAPVNAIFTLVIVFAIVSLGMISAGGVIAAGFKLAPPMQQPREPSTQTSEASPPIPLQTRVAQIAAAARAMEQRDAARMVTLETAPADRRTQVIRVEAADRLKPVGAEGQALPRRAAPRDPRSPGKLSPMKPSPGKKS